MLKFLFRVFLALVIVLILAVLFRATLFRAVVHYEVLRERRSTIVANAEPTVSATREINEVIDAALDSTAHLLRFTTGRASNQPSVLRHGGDANCIGYAALFASLVRNELDEMREGGKFRVEHLIAQLHIGDHNLHDAFNSPFWKDHDIVRITDLRNGSVIYVDPTLYDAVGIGYVTGP